MNIAVIGNSHFGSILVKQLSQYDDQNNYSFYDTNEKKLDKLKFALNIFNIDIVYSVSASIRGGGALTLAGFCGKKIVQHFIGSDVLSAVKDYENNNISKKMIKQSTYLCEVKWIEDELKEIGVNAEVVTIMAYKQKENPKIFKKFSVLTYMAKGKEEFYGMCDFIALAKCFPEITFKIAGIKSYDDLPKNIICLGWVNMIDELQNATVFIRNAEHDGLGFSVIEALSLGRVTFYNYNFPCVNYFKGYYDLKNKFLETTCKFENANLNINYNAIEFVKENYNEGKVLKNLVEAITK